MKQEKKLRILAAGDIHGDTKLARELAEKAKKEKVDLVILTGDIVGMIETENIIKPFTDRNEKVVFVPGNWDSPDTAAVLSKLYGIKNLDDYDYVRRGINSAFKEGAKRTNGIFEAHDETTDELKGYKIFDFSKRSMKNIKIPLPVNVDFKSVLK